ncbi:hypothetical protein ACFLYY_01685 [Patescibacteria group bacterium]
MNYSKIFGWILIIVGITIIIWTLISSYNVFTGKNAIPEVFSLPTKIGDVQASDIQAQLENLVKEQLTSIIPTDAITKTLNLMTWSILAFILIFGGSQIAGLGIKLINKQS